MKADRYSKVVGWLKVLLPLMALALLSTLFLLSRVIDPKAVIPFADKEIQDRLRDQQVTGPIYYSVTADGDEISFAAEKVTTPEGNAGGNEAEQVEVVMKLDSGSEVILNASRGYFDIAADSTSLQGDVVINTSNGYRINSDLLVTQMSALGVISPGPVAATGPVGTLDAGAMTLNAGKPSHLVFTNGVKLIYRPQQDRE
ncbi:hypothetical protein HKX54_10670 [Sulfitobacter sp. M57]|uniref:hypothetical protein n=1 Tax=unclassified Sulfitobacter TaxID=196795 RepID=UPI0023E1CDE2|nr:MULTISPECIES: hypothetical protein [unclassified Sulfitobacter]MDF3414917.1 hypothetical protein [Sulfitobacter sp. KE5]MDF3422398.1 hypothetical protein [Sulfitobacter sp. KE43]MDF3433463.1 hypothetical protein [Sulfitobacter sp. KE42]MDF3459103.1 hypothetical protein [Sulfitobacter sp. S74]MDF3463002.1 hypothetical protein [Sulfitobacter sp. Ks18]